MPEVSDRVQFGLARPTRKQNIIYDSFLQYEGCQSEQSNVTNMSAILRQIDTI